MEKRADFRAFIGVPSAASSIRGEETKRGWPEDFRDRKEGFSRL
jgi:hypothetical protein